MTPASLQRLVASHRTGAVAEARIAKPTISGVLGRVGRRWRIVEVWNVYPG